MHKVFGDFDIVKVVFINTGIFTFVSLTGVEMILKIVLLILTIIYTVFKLIMLIKNKGKVK